MNFNWQHDTDYLAIIQDLLNTKDVQNLKHYIHHKHTSRFDHVIQVSYKSYKIACRLHLNARAVARAGLLHDLYFIEGHYHDKTHGHAYLHPRVALQNACKITTLTDMEKDIILKHMFGSTLALPRYKESWLVNLVDDVQAIDDYSAPMSFKYELKIYQSTTQRNN